MSIFRRAQSQRLPAPEPSLFWSRGERRLTPPAEDMPPRPAGRVRRLPRDDDGIPDAARDTMSGPVRPEWDPCGRGPLRSGESA
jgi:hypothetical protein